MQCKSADPGPGPGLFQKGGGEHDLLKVEKLQCKTAGHGPGLFQQWGLGNTVWLRLQSHNVKLLAMVLVYSSVEVQEHGPGVFWWGWGT